MAIKDDNSQSASYAGPEIRIEEYGTLRVYFDGHAIPMVVCAETVGWTREQFSVWFHPDAGDKIDAAWVRWAALLQSEVGQALRWWSATAFLRDGISVKVRMG